MGSPIQYDMAGIDLVVNKLRVGATTPGAQGTELTGSEITVLDSVTAGTVTASKAVVVDASKNIGSFVNVTGTNFIVPVTSATAASTGTAITNSGFTTLTSTVAKAYTLTAPVAGYRKVITCTAAGTAGKTVSSGTGVTFNGTDIVATFNANEETLELVGLSTARWAVVGNIGTVGLTTA